MFKKISLILAGSLLSLTALANSPAVEANHVNIKAARVELATMGPLGQAQTTTPSTEAKMDIINTGTTPITLVAATSPIATQVQLHEIVTTDGKKTMQQIEYVKIKPNSEKDLSFNGVHIMLIGLKHALKATEEIPLTLIFADGSHIKVNATVKAATQVTSTNH